MKVSLISAIGLQNQIGLNGKLPWAIYQDLMRFRATTMGHHMIMGRKTFESLKGPFAGRTNIILSQSQNTCDTIELKGIPSLFATTDIYKAIDIAKNARDSEVFIIGGSEIYKKSLELQLIDKIYLTKVQYSGQADTFFPDFSVFEHDFEEIHRESWLASDINEYAADFIIYQRKTP